MSILQHLINAQLMIENGQKDSVCFEWCEDMDDCTPNCENCDEWFPRIQGKLGCPNHYYTKEELLKITHKAILFFTEC